MDSSIYIDNTRGFSKCLVKLSPITLLVGENSSGKSSFLALAHLLLSDNFWENPNFNDFSHELGSFNDIVSKSSKSRSEITVGSALKNNPESNLFFGSIVTFISKDDTPQVSRCTYLHGTKIISYILSGSGYRWIMHGDLNELSEASSSDQVLTRLVELHGQVKNGMGKLVKKSPRRSNFFLLAMSHFIGRELEAKYGDKIDWAVDFIPEGGIGNGTWFAPIRAEPHRIYENPSELVFSPIGQHTPYLLREVLKKRKKSDFAKSAYEMIKAFGKSSGLFDELVITSFGKSASAPFTLSVKLNEDTFHVGEVGYGVSQVLPIVVEMYAVSSSRKYFMQQPEVHLHPKAQAELGNVLYIYSATIENSLLVVETHSDYLIDRLRTLIREDYLDKAININASILWFERKDGINIVHKIEIDKKGEISGDVPEGYRNFFVNETLRGLGLDANN